MQKIISLFQRNYDGDRLVRNEVVPGAEWVLAGEGVATQKIDGTCCLIRDGKLFKRYEVRKGGKPPAGFEPATDVDPNTGKQQGWLLVGEGPEDRWHREAFKCACEQGVPPDGTYELLGPKVQGNPEGLGSHVLMRHGMVVLADCPRDFEGLREWLRGRNIEGVVWHHPDGRMVKIKAKDFGLRRTAPST
jgi:hypothetical protein